MTIILQTFQYQTIHLQLTVSSFVRYYKVLGNSFGKKKYINSSNSEHLSHKYRMHTFCSFYHDFWEHNTHNFTLISHIRAIIEDIVMATKLHLTILTMYKLKGEGKTHEELGRGLYMHVQGQLCHYYCLTTSVRFHGF